MAKITHSEINVNPVLVETLRGDLIECCHRGAFAVVDAGGSVIAAEGRIDIPVYARSSAKPLQCLPLLETGAADAFRLDDLHIALACASHNGEPDHIRNIDAWLHRLDLDRSALACGIQIPLHSFVHAPLYRHGIAVNATYNNCSGKHCGFLTTARHCGETIDTYIAADHPVQRRIDDVIATLSGYDTAAAPRGIDGCGIPVIGIPLHGWASSFAQFACPDNLDATRAAAIHRIVAAMIAHPEALAGAKRSCTALTRLCAGRAMLKDGADGFYAAALPERGLGIALKIDDGRGRAADCAIAALLARFGAFGSAAEADADAVASWRTPTLRNWARTIIGSVRPTAILDPAA